MPYTPREHPEFSWSHSRDRRFADCRRQYYWQHYGSHRGWERGADEEARTAYRLKQLRTLAMVLGIEVHDRARETAAAIRDGQEPPSLGECRERTRRELNRHCRASRDKKGFLRSPKRHGMLLETYYGLPISSDYLVRLRAKMETCLARLCSWPGWEEVAECRPDEILLYEPTDPVEYDGVPLYAAPDLVYRVHGSPWQILDWKTGSLDGAEEQLSMYALYLRERGGLQGYDGTAMGRIVRLDEGEDMFIEITPAHLERAAERIRGSVSAMRGHLVELDPERNEAQPRAKFPTTASTDQCRWCPYYELCEPELQNPEHPGPF